MTATATDWEQYVGKKVIVTKNDVDANDDPISVEVEGTVEAANQMGVLIKPKGKTQFDLIDAADVEQIVLAPEGDKKIKAKKILPIELGKARAHLLERHGGTLTEVNAMTEEEAYDFHLSIDHVAADLGHVHEAKKDKGSDTDAESQDAGE